MTFANLKQIKSSTQTTTTTQTIKTSTRTTIAFSSAPSLADVRVWQQSKFATGTTDTFRSKTDFSKVFKFYKTFLILMKTLNCDVVNSNLLSCCCTVLPKSLFGKFVVIYNAHFKNYSYCHLNE
jgi:hypothetical protein